MAPTCQLRRVHELSYAHPISTGVVAGQMIERGTCCCGQPVARFVFEGQGLTDSQAFPFPMAELAAVVAGLAAEPLGPEPPSGVTCERCHATNVPAAAHWCPAILGAANGDDAEHTRIVATLAERGWFNLTDQQLAELGAADPFGEGHVLRGARVVAARAELVRKGCSNVTDQQLAKRLGVHYRDPVATRSRRTRYLIAGGLALAIVVLGQTTLGTFGDAAPPPVSTARAELIAIANGYVSMTSESTLARQSNARRSAPQRACPSPFPDESDPVAFATACGGR